MTVTTDTRSIVYNGDGSTTAFPVDFYFLENGDLVVTLIDAAGVDHVQTITTDYTVSGAGNEEGGSVTMMTAPAAGEKLRIERLVDILQPTNYPENTKFPAASHERALDRLTMIDQQQQGEINRAPKFSETSGVVDIELPTPEDGKGIKFDAETGKYVNTELDPDQAQSDASEARDEAVQARNFAARWASDPEDGPPIDDGTNPPGQSSYHWSRKSQAFSVEAEQAANEVAADDRLFNYASRAVVTGAVIPSLQDIIRLGGYHTAGDGGGALYKRVVSEPSHAGKIQSADGAWWELAETTVNPAMFGGVPQDAVDYIDAIGGGVLEVTEDTAITDTLNLCDNLTLKGAGGKIALDTTANVDVIAAVQKSHVIITGLEIDGMKSIKDNAIARGHGIHLKGCSNATIIGNYIHDCWEHGIRVGSNPTDDFESNNIVVANNRCIDNGNATNGRGYGIWFFWRVHHFVIDGNVCRDNVAGGIMVDDSSGDATPDKECTHFAITGNSIYGTPTTEANREGIGVSGSQFFSIAGNKVYGYEHGISVDSGQARNPCRHGTVTGNHVESEVAGIDLVQCQEIVVSSNYVRLLARGTGPSEAILINNNSSPGSAGCDAITVTGNTILSPGEGIRIGQSTTDTQLTNIVVSDNHLIFSSDVAVASGDDGIRVNFTDGVVISGNVIRGFYQGIDADSNAVDNVIKGNVLLDLADVGCELSNVTLLLDNVFRNMNRSVSIAAAGANSSDSLFKGNLASGVGFGFGGSYDQITLRENSWANTDQRNSRMRHLFLQDGVSAPSTSSGDAFLYVDADDGDLKVKFGDGTVKTIATDT